MRCIMYLLVFPVHTRWHYCFLSVPLHTRCLHYRVSTRYWYTFLMGLGGFPPPLAFSPRRFPTGLFPPGLFPPGQVPPRSFPTRAITHPALSPRVHQSFSPALFPRPSSHPVFMLNPRDRKKQNGILECHALLKNEIHCCYWHSNKIQSSQIGK